MGRLLRKKPAAVKRKKRKDTEQAGDQANGSSSIASKSSSTAKNGEIKKRLPLVTKKNTSSSKTPSTAGKPGYIGQAIQFLREVKVELKKVTWPSRKQTIGSTVVVIIMVMIISFFLGAVDIGLSSLVRVILQ